MACKRNQKGNVEYKTLLETLEKFLNLSVLTIGKSMVRLSQNLFDDYNHDGFLTLDDFKEMNKRLKFKMSPEELFKELDKKGNGKITREGLIFKH
jgi:Ca2+-binding EF-hand superfamily protein